jgi:hypothetical protein
MKSTEDGSGLSLASRAPNTSRSKPESRLRSNHVVSCSLVYI